MRHRRRWLAVMFAAVGALGLIACGGGSKKNGPAAAGPAATTAISIKEFAFHPGSLRIAAGTTVTVRNDDGTEHTATADDKSFDTGHIVGGATATFKVPRSGAIAYHCDIHNYMRGSIQAT